MQKNTIFLLDLHLKFQNKYRVQYGKKTFYDESWGTDSVYVVDLNSLNTIDLSKLAHEVVHAIDYRLRPELPVEFKEYRAYVLEYRFSDSLVVNGSVDVKVLDHLFGSRSIAGSSHGFNQQFGLSDPWTGSDTLKIDEELRNARSYVITGKDWFLRKAGELSGINLLDDGAKSISPLEGCSSCLLEFVPQFEFWLNYVMGLERV